MATTVHVRTFSFRGPSVSGLRPSRRRCLFTLHNAVGKMWTTNGLTADWMCCLANTSSDGGPHRNKTMIILPLDSKGVTVERKLSARSAPCSAWRWPLRGS